MGIDTRRPEFSWIYESKVPDTRQVQYRLQVFDKGRKLWDTGALESGQSFGIKYAGRKLESFTMYDIEAKSWSNHGEAAEDSGWFETGLLYQEDWTAKWVVPKQVPAYREKPQETAEISYSSIKIEDIKMQPGQMIRMEFKVKPCLRSARIYATAHGIYRLELNGRRVGDMEYAPGNSSYNRCLEYQTYDITDGLKTGDNALGMTICPGWYCGKVGLTGDSCQYGTLLAGLFQIEVLYENGQRERFGSGETCCSETGPVKYADLFVGECYDARDEKKNFSLPGYRSRELRPVRTADYGYENLCAQAGEPVRVCETLRPARIYQSPRGETILDTGQVLCGRVKMKVCGKRGTKVVLEHTETVDQHGNFVRNIIGEFVLQTDTYILHGEGPEIFEPSFTYHGFRYVRISGYPGEPKPEDFEIQVIYTDMEMTGGFCCSDERLNQLQHNILWSQKSNMVSVPTDCPQREKAGFTGDAQIFIPTACRNMDVLEFFMRWLKLMREEQLEDGQIPIIVPYLPAYHPNSTTPYQTHTSAGWGDAAVIVPWRLYQAYGQKSILEENYAMMEKWIEYIRYTAEHEYPESTDSTGGNKKREEWEKYLWNTNFHFGDWLTPSVSIDQQTGDVDMLRSAYRTMDIVPTCFYAYSTELMAQIAQVLGKYDDVQYYKQLNENVRNAFIRAFTDGKGMIKTKLQGIYVLALQFHLIPEEYRKHTSAMLVRLIEENDGRLDTGFLSIPFLLDVLVEAGYTKTAFDILFQDECPSWLYEVKMGATTVWEMWQAVKPDGGVTCASYNHYAFGCAGDWMYRKIGGIHAACEGYREIVVKPLIDPRITYAWSRHRSPYGNIEVYWEVKNRQIYMETEIPCGTAAKVYIPHRNGTYKEKQVKSGHYIFQEPFV